MPKPTTLCLMPEFSNQLRGGIIQWLMGLLLFWSQSACGMIESLLLRSAALVLPSRQGCRLRSGDVPSPHSGHAEVVWLVLVWQGGKVGPVL